MPDETSKQPTQPVTEEPATASEPTLSESDEEIISQRLRELGYIE